MEILRRNCPPGAVVLDPFCGSGTVPVAALRSGRHYVGCELDPQTHAFTVDRVSKERVRLAAAAAAQGMEE